MKQQITVEQLYELNKESQRKLFTWCYLNRYYTRHIVPGESAHFSDTKTGESFKVEQPLLSIGQMIEFLYEHKKGLEPDSLFFMQEKYAHEDGSWEIVPETLCDDLWKDVVEVLEKI